MTEGRAPFWNDARVVLAGALLMVLSNATAHMLMLPPYHAVDEGRHLGYAVALADGHIPHVLDKIDPSVLKLKDIKGTNIQAAAAHPPLYHAIVAFPVKKLSAADHAAVAVRFARSVSIIFGLASVLMIWRLVRTLLPTRTDILAIVLGALGCLPIFTFAVSVAYNDSLAMLGVTGALAATAAASVQGFKRRLWIECAIWMAVAGSTRMTAFLATMPVALAWWVIAAKRSDAASRVRRHLAGALVGGGLFFTTALACGWFYVRNVVLYGDPTAATALLDRLDRVPHGYFRAFVLRSGVLYEQHWTRIVGGVVLPESSERYAHLLMLLAGVGSVVLFVRWVRRKPRPLPLGPARLAWATVAGSALINLVLVLAFHAKGGDITPRYILAFAWLQMLLLLVPMTWPKKPSLVLGVLLSMAIMHFLIMDAYAAEQIGTVLLSPDRPGRRGTDFSVAMGIRRSGVPLPGVWFVGLLVLYTTGLVMVLGAVLRRYKPTLGALATGGEGGRLDLPSDDANPRPGGAGDEKHE
ncbi:MAG: hypothetical protein JNL21_24310 [Myxococcales bacterium]|nr:hypothetical protein [Myxococcales bacterium]